jgi:ornithine cyclodeaminase/alanine dehydrogenase-like protein (mu-crystallin family)
VQSDPTIRYLTDEDARAASQFVDAVKLVRQAHTERTEWGAAAYPALSLESPQRAGGLLRAHIGLAWPRADNLGGVSVNFERVALGSTQPRFEGGMVLLVNGKRAQVVCALTTAFLRMLRIAAGTVVIAQKLLVDDATSAALLGVLPDADLQLRLMAERLPGLTRVTIADADHDKAAALCTRLAGDLGRRGIDLHAADIGRDAVTGSDLVVSLSAGPVARIAYDWLTTGALVVLDGPGAAGADADVVLRADLLVTDDWPAVRDDERGLLGQLHRAGLLGGPPGSEPATPGHRHVEAELGAVFAGRHPGRRSRDDIVVVARHGLVLEDITLAAAIYHSARRLGLGIDVPTHRWEPFGE